MGFDVPFPTDLILLGYIGHSVDLRYGIQYLSFDSIGLKNATVKDATAGKPIMLMLLDDGRWNWYVF